MRRSNLQSTAPGFSPTELVLAFLVALALAALATALDGWPAPRVFDEFSQILAGDTFARGRLTNPAHPLPAFFETFHVLQQPTYSSKYFPGHGLFLALGIVLGDSARLGQWIAFATMAPALLWMLSGWITRRGALAASTILILLLADTSWASGYWGSALAVTGGALVFGALPRLTGGRRPEPRVAALMGLGVVALALTRPFEGLALCLPLGGFYACWILVPARARAERLLRVALPTLLLIGAGGALLARHNLAVTGSALQTGYALYEAGAPGAPPFGWQKPTPIERSLRVNEQVRVLIDMEAYSGLTTWWSREMRHRLSDLTIPFYLPHAGLLLLLVLAPFGMRDWRHWLAAASIGSVAMATAASSYYLPHYIGPALAPLLLLFAVGTGVLRRLTIQGRAIGRYAVSGLLAALAFLATVQIGQHDRDESELANPRHWTRRHEALELHLRSLPGKHLVFVTYGPEYRSQTEWVQNSADLEGTRVLWAHDLGEATNAELLAMAPERTVWRLLVPGGQAGPPAFGPYERAEITTEIPPDLAPGFRSGAPYRR